VRAPTRPIRFDGLTLRHGRQPAVTGLTGCLAAGSLTAIVGPNGAGKTTLLRAIAGLHKPAQGRIDRGGLLPRDIALLPQASALDRRFPITCLDVVALGHAARFGAFRAIGQPELAAAAAALAAVGMADAVARPVGSLSAGQFQRLLFARMMVQDAAVLLLDEPFSAVDTRTTEELTRLLQCFHAEGRTVAAVLHDLDLVRRAFPQTLLLACEPIAWGATGSALTEANRLRARLAAEAWDERRAAA
jgi:zinc/manganese transport system ATP-binding protein